MWARPVLYRFWLASGFASVLAIVVAFVLRPADEGGESPAAIAARYAGGREGSCGRCTQRCFRSSCSCRCGGCNRGHAGERSPRDLRTPSSLVARRSTFVNGYDPVRSCGRTQARTRNSYLQEF